MYVFYDSTGKIIGGCAADSPDVVLTRIPDGTTPFYLDDTQYANVWTDMGEYIIENGAPVYTPIPDSVKLSNSQTSKKAELLAKRDETILAGFTSSTTGHTYYYGESDQRKLQGQASLLALDSTVTSVDWLTVDAGLVTHTRDEFIAVLKEAGQFERDQHTKFYTLESQVNAATTVADVEAIVWS